MMKQLFMGCALAVATLTAHAQQAPEAYRLYDHAGKAASYEQVVEGLAEADVAFIGEIHNCTMTHWLELKLLQALYNKHAKEGLTVGMEMLEADNQLIVDEYLQGTISSDRFEAECRLWDNYSTDYEPLVYFAKRNGLNLVGTNVPRRYASVVKERGLAYLDSLSAEAKSFLPPLPIAYQANDNASEGFALMAMLGKGKGADPDRMAQAQAIKDATMAWHIAQALKGGKPMVHFNGNIHTDSGEGIVTYLKQYAPKATFKTIRAVRQEGIDQLDSTYLGLADFYICVPEDMSMSY